MRNQLLHFGVTATTSDYTYRDQPDAVGHEPALPVDNNRDRGHLGMLEAQAQVDVHH